VKFFRIHVCLYFADTSVSHTHEAPVTKRLIRMYIVTIFNGRYGRVSE